MAPVTLSRFIDPTFPMPADIETIPNLGPSSRARFAENGIHSTYQLFGTFLKLGRDEVEFKRFLDLNDGYPQHTAAIAKAIARRVKDVGIKLNVSLPDHVTQSSRIKDDQAKEFVQRVFTGELEHDFQGFGFGKPGAPSVSVTKLKKCGIVDTDALFGEFLNCFDGEPTPEMVTKFWTSLGDMGVAHGYKATICDALKLQLDIGIDQTGASMNATAWDSIPEEPASPMGNRPSGPKASDSPRTDEQPRYRTSRATAAPAPAASIAAPRQEARAMSAQVEASSSPMPLALMSFAGVALAFYYFFVRSPEVSSALQLIG